MTMTVRNEAVEQGAATTDDKTMSALPRDDALMQGTEVSKKDLIEKHKKEGNTHYSAKQYPEAITAYRAGLEACDANDFSEYEVALRSNLAVTLLKVEDYAAAQEECSLALTIDTTNPKVWYRRALAREGLADACNANEDSQIEQTFLLDKALEDIQSCLEQIARVVPQTPATKTMKRAADGAMARVTEKLQKLNGNGTVANDIGSNGDSPRAAVSRQQQQETNGNHVRTETPAAASTIAPFSSPSQQRQDVIRLLMTNSNTFHSMQGEAFFLLDWNWWCQWCRHADFFPCANDENDGELMMTQKHEAILQMLPPGAVLPTYVTEKKKQDDDSSSTSSSTSSDSSDSTSNKQHEGPPHEIDNSALFVQPHSNSNKTNKKMTYSKLKPNLVRGHHYELIPREVYNALRIWYGEVTPSICRRVEVHQEIAKLPLYTDFSVKQQENAEASLAVEQQRCGACRAPSANCRCTQCFQAFYCGRSCQESHWPYHKLVCKQLAANSEEEAERYLHTDPGGRVGLHNLGNTCFMNSALQCLSHATPLTRHFLSNKYKTDLNTSNPLGTGGKLATAYESVLKDIWLKTGITSTSPTDLKRAIAQFAPRFAGCSQHDAQEFLAYLLDGLHEDLNRIRKPPYVEMPEVGLENMAIAGAKAWELHQRRNDSLVMDTFYGQFKSTCVCPKCDRVSVSFDAFNHVALEIPPQQELDRGVPIILFRAPKDDGPVGVPQRYGVTVKRGSFAVDLRQELSELCGIPSNCLHICDVYDHAIFEIIKDNKPVSIIRGNDVLAAYEVPPYNDHTIHCVATHALVIKENVADRQMDVATELEVSAELSQETASLEPLGFPFLTAFDLHSTCQEVWNQVWGRAINMAAPEFLAKHCDGGDVDNLKSLLRIRIVDNAGKARPVFLDDVDISNILGVDEEIDRASLLPSTSEQELMKYLGKDCADRFLFVRLEWADRAAESNDKIRKEEKADAAFTFDKESFFRFDNHASLMEAMNKLRQAQQGNTGVTLDKCFDTFTKPERLDEHNMWYCSKCKEHVRAMKTMELWRLPNILVITLKRFEFKHILRRDKLDTPVDFPLDGLDMSKHCSSTKLDGDSFVEDNVPAIYDLFAVTNHYGRMGFGHYTAFARRWDEHGMSNDWALYDDSSVQSVGDGKGINGRNGIVSPAAYILFYRRRVFH